MFYDYDFLFTSICIIVLLLSYYFRRYHLPVDRNRDFLRLLIIEAVVMALDTISTYMDDYHARFSISALYIVNLMFFLTFITRAFFFYWYASSFFDERYKHRKFMIEILAMGWVFLISTLGLHHVFAITAKGYVSGPFYNVLYVYNAIYFISSLIFVTISEQMTQREKGTLVAYNLLLIGGSIVRYCFPWMPIMDFFCTLALIMIYLGIQNPDLVIDRKTGLFNGTGLYYYVNEQFAKGHKLNLVMVSIDRYLGMKTIYGPVKIHQCLKQIGDEMMGEYRRYVLAYKGGGQFFLATPESLDVHKFMHYIDGCFRHPFRISDDEDIYLSYCLTSFDSSVKLTDDVNVISLMHQVNYKAQKSGNGIVNQVTNEDVDQYRRIVEVEDAVNKAVNCNLIEVYYQPIYHIKSHKIIGAEALSRLYDEHLGFISPEEFIAAAERMGMIQKLGCQVLEKVCQLISSYDLEALGLHYINVNLSPLQCLDERFPEMFDLILDRYQVDPSWIHLEITESTAIDMNVLSHMMNEMVKRGVEFNLDDYGTGFSNITRISKYPFSTIKIDLTLTWSYFKGENQLLPHILSMLSEMGKKVTVEGVETKEMVEALSNMKADHLQGYYFSKPLPKEEFLSYLEISLQTVSVKMEKKHDARTQKQNATVYQKKTKRTTQGEVVLNNKEEYCLES